jgi:hypothetical protein
MELPLETPFGALWVCATEYRKMVISGWFAVPRKPNDPLIEVKVPDVFHSPKKIERFIKRGCSYYLEHQAFDKDSCEDLAAGLVWYLGIASETSPGKQIREIVWLYLLRTLLKYVEQRLKAGEEPTQEGLEDCVCDAMDDPEFEKKVNNIECKVIDITFENEEDTKIAQEVLANAAEDTN